MPIEIIHDEPAQLGEGPVWWKDRLWWVDIDGCRLHACLPERKEVQTFKLPSKVGAVVPCFKRDAMLLAMEDGLYFFNPANGELSRLPALGKEEMAGRFNDGKCDPAGRFWAGTIAEKDGRGIGHLYRVDMDLSVTVQLEGIGCSNGLAWSRDGSRMYYIDSTPNRLYGFDYDLSTGSISRQEIILQYPDGPDQPRLDGMTIDRDGRLWIALWGGGAVIRVDPLSGEELERISLPALNVTSCAFGGPDLEDLFITTASIGLTEEQALQFPEAGMLFCCRPGAYGLPAHSFSG